MTVANANGSCEIETEMEVLAAPCSAQVDSASVTVATSETICVDIVGLPGALVAIEECASPIFGMLSDFDETTGCFVYTAGPEASVIDSLCVLVRDDAGNTDTTFITVRVLPATDTIELVVAAGETLFGVACGNFDELSGTTFTAASCGDPSLGTLSEFDQETLCVDYTAPTTGGVSDTFCIVVSDSQGFVDTTIVVVEVTQNASAVTSINDINVAPVNTTVRGNVFSSDLDLTGEPKELDLLIVDADGEGVLNDTVQVGVPVPVFGTDNAGNTVLAGTITFGPEAATAPRFRSPNLLGLLLPVDNPAGGLHVRARHGLHRYGRRDLWRSQRCHSDSRPGPPDHHGLRW